MEGDKSSEGRSIYADGSAMASAVSSGDGSKSNETAPTLDKKAFADQFEQRMQAKIEKEKGGDNGDLTKKAPDAPSPAETHVTCAAGHHCMADPEIATDLTRSPHECLNCCEKMHDPSTCGEMFDDVEDIHGFAVPTDMLSENGQLQLRGQGGASNLAICCMCIERFRLPCLLKGTTAETSTQAAKGGLEVIEGGPPAPIEDSIYQDSAKKELNMKLESARGGDEAPRPSAYASAQYDEMDAAIKRAVKNTSQMSPPVPPAAEAKIAAMVEDTEIENKKKAFISPDGVGGNGGDPEQQNALSEDGVQSAVSRAQAQQTAPIITRPPPRSMLPSNQQSTPSLPVIQATLVEDEPQAPVYDAIPLQSSGRQSVPWWKRRAVLGMGCVIVALAVTVGALIGVQGGDNDNESASSGNVSDRGDGLLGSNSDNESTSSESINAEGGSDTSDELKEVAVLNSHQPSQYPSQQSATPSFSTTCNGNVNTSPVSISDAIRGKGIVFAIQSDVDDEDGLQITSLGFHVNTENLKDGSFIDYEVYALKDDVDSPDGYYAHPSRNKNSLSLLLDPNSFDYRGDMKEWELIAAGNITSLKNLTLSVMTLEPNHFQIPFNNFENTSVPGKGKVRSFYIATPQTTSFIYVDPPSWKTLNSELELFGSSAAEGGHIPKVLVGEGVVGYPMSETAFMYQPKSFVGTVYWEGRCQTLQSSPTPTLSSLDSLQPSQYPSQQSSLLSFSPICAQYNYITTSPVFIADTISGKGIVFAIQSDVDDEDGLEITSLGFHVNTDDLEGTRSFIEYEVYALSDGAGSPDGYYADPNRSEDFNNVLTYDFRGKMDQWELIAAGNITSIDNLTQAITTMDNTDPDYFQIPYESFTKTSVPGKGRVRSFYIATPRTASFYYVDPPAGELVNSESALSEVSLMEGEYIPKILTGEGVATYPMDASAFMYQTKSFVGTVYWERVSRPPLAQLRVCRCANNNGGGSGSSSSSDSHNCLDGPLVMKGGENNMNPELRLCFFLNDPRVDISLDDLEISQEETNALMKLISNGELSGSADVEYDSASDGKLAITVPKVSAFFLSDGDTEGRLPAITMKGSASVGAYGDSTKELLDFSVVIPLQVTVDGSNEYGVVEVNDGLPSASPSILLSHLPSSTNSPSYPYAPSTHPSETVPAVPIMLPSTSGPTDKPSSSGRPSIEHDPSIVACICDPSRMGKVGKVCLDDDMFSEVENNLHVCLQTRPANVELVKITFLAIAQTFRDGTSVFDVLINPVINEVHPSINVIQYANNNRLATIVTEINPKFFRGIPSGETRATLQGFALIKANSGSQFDSSFHVDLTLVSVPSAAPTTSGAPSTTIAPSLSIAPTVLRKESIEACQCDALQKCIEEPLVPSSRDVRLCLLSTPQMNILESIVVMYLTQPGADEHLIVRADTAKDSETKIDASIRRRVVETVVPLYFFSNLSETVVVKGVGKVLRTGTVADNTRDIEFTIPLTLNSEPSDAPSTSVAPTVPAKADV